MSERRRVHILGVPLDHGAGRRGVGMGPSAVRIAGLHDALMRLGYEVKDLGDLPVPAPETCAVGDPRARYLETVAATCETVAGEVQGILGQGGLPLVVGGDHSIAIGTVSGLAAYLATKKGDRKPREIGVLWFDAHGDANTPETTPTGNIHGMPVACLLGKGPEPLTKLAYPGPKVQGGRCAQIGLRDVDELEKRFLRESQVHAYTMMDIDRRGMAAVVEEALRHVADGADMLHVTFDVDVVDPQVAPGTGTRKLGGLTYREAHLALEIVAESGRLTSFEMVEVNPTLDQQNQTAELAVGLIASALGKRIL
jgi:arginase